MSIPKTAATVTAGIKWLPSGKVNAESVPASTIKPLPVTPTAPFDDTIKIIKSVITCSIVTGILKACAKKITTRLKYIFVASRLKLYPVGIISPTAALSIPAFSSFRIRGASAVSLLEVANTIKISL